MVFKFFIILSGNIINGFFSVLCVRSIPQMKMKMNNDFFIYPVFL